MTKQKATKEKSVKANAPVIAESKLFKTDTEIAKAIVAAEKKGASLQSDYQRIAASAIVHLAKHKDIRIIRRMMEQFPEGLRRNTMLAYLERFGQVTVQNVEQEKGSEQVIVFDAKKKLDLNGALTTQWWKAAKEPEYKPLDLEAMINNVINLAEKRLQKGISADKGDKVDAKTLAGLKALVAKKA